MQSDKYTIKAEWEMHTNTNEKEGWENRGVMEKWVAMKEQQNRSKDN